jgi:hypothetical protein
MMHDTIEKVDFISPITKFIGNEQKMQETPAVYYVKPDGIVIRVIDNIEFPHKKCYPMNDQKGVCFIEP